MDIDKIADKKTGATSVSLTEEMSELWKQVPEKGFFLFLFFALIAIFHLLGNSQYNFTKTSSLFLWMWGAWGTESQDASHGKLIPIVVLVLLWHKRKELLESIKGTWWPALIPFGFSLLLHVIGYAIQQPRLSIIALFLGLYSLVGLTWGKRTLHACFFPFVLFAFCMPFGNTIDKLLFSLRLLSTVVTTFITRDLLGVPLTRVGTQIFDANGGFSYDVAAACSGIRSLFGLLAITTIFSMLLLKKPWKRAVMIAYAIPLAILCNVMRLTAIVLATKGYGTSAGTFVHEWFGFVTYAISIAGVMLLAHFLREPQLSTTPLSQREDSLS